MEAGAGWGGQAPIEKKKAGLIVRPAFCFEVIPAATYVPTQLPVQYHRPGEA
jgi:hypothetical protein